MAIVQSTTVPNGGQRLPPPNVTGTSLPQNGRPNAPMSPNSDIGKMPVSQNMVGATRVDEAYRKATPGKYEISSESDFTIEVHLKKYKGRWILMNGSDDTTDDHSVVFRMWTYNEMVEMKKMATSYDLRKKVHEIDNDLLNRLKIQRLMKSWTFGRDNKNLEIQHAGGTMTDESWVAFTKLQPNIAQYILDEMNMVLEYNH